MSQDYLDKLIEKDKAGTQIQSIPLHDTELRGITIDDPITVEGNPINFSTKNEQNAIQTMVNLEPIQDLHGYSKPWVGGAGKNLCETVDRNVTLYGVTIKSDSTIEELTMNGTVSGGSGSLDTNSYVMHGNLVAGTYKVKVFSSSAYPSSNSFLRLLNYTTNIIIQELLNINTDYTFTLSASAEVRVVPRVGTGDTFNNFKYKIMIVKSTDSMTTWEPYTNICPILPHEEIKIGGCGKNIWTIDHIADISDNTNYELTDTGIRVYSTGSYSYRSVRAYIDDIPQNKTLTFSFSMTETSGQGAVGIQGSINGIDYENISATVVGNNRIFNSGSYKMLRFQFFCTRATTTSGNVTYSNLQLEINSNSTSYEPYTLSNQLTLPLPEDVYGGTLNLETGEMVVNNTIKTYSGTSSENWAITGSKFAYINVPDAKSVSSSSEIFNAISNEYEVRSLNNVQTVDPTNGLALATNNNMIIFSEGKTNDLTTWKTHLANNPLQICYELSTPYTLHLTPAQLKLFKDVNNLNSSDYTTLTVTYHSNSIATLAPATDTTDGLLTAMDKRALDRTEEIIEGNPIAFETESAQVAKSTIVDLEPIQDLHGFTKPWVGGSGKNLMPLTLADIKANNTSGSWSDNAYTLNNVTFTVLTDSDDNVIGIKVNNTTAASSNTQFDLVGVVNNADYIGKILNGCPANGSVNTYKLIAQVYSGSWEQFAIDTGNGVTITDSGATNIRFLIQIGSGITVSNLVFYPMIRLSTVTDATFEPYTNIASISGRSEVDILGCGKNLYIGSPSFDGYTNVGLWTKDTISYNGHDVYKRDTAWGGIYKRFYLPVGTYVFSLMAKASASVRTFFYINYGGDTQKANYVIDGSNIKNIEQTWSKYSVKFNITKAGYVCCRIEMESDGKTLYISEYQLEYGETPTPFESYTQSTSLQIQLGQTVYGGQLDVENGVLVADRVIEDLGSLDWNYANNIFTALLQADSYKYSTGVYSISEWYQFVGTVANGTSDMGNKPDASYALYYNQNYPSSRVIYIKDTRYSDAASFKTAMNGVQLCYELSTPTTISLTPEQVKLLQGVNTITTNADNITLTYRNGSVATLNDLESLYAKLKAYIDSLHAT